MVVELCSVKSAFVAANALEASTTANPSSRLFEIVANFIAAPYFSSQEITSGSG
jgi:hypothetical protein